MTLPNYTSPVGTEEQRIGGKIWPTGWGDATGYARRYRIGTPNEAYHTGADLNCNTPRWDSDAHSGVYSMAEGVIMSVGKYKGWGNIIIVFHSPVKGSEVYARYAHIENILVVAGQEVKQGEQIASVGNADGLYPYHLHADISPTDILRRNPAHWPKLNLTELKNNYVDPKQFLISQQAEAQAPTRTVYTLDRLNVRSLPTTASRVLRVLDKGVAVKVLDQDAEWWKLAGDLAYISKKYTTSNIPQPTPPPTYNWQPAITPAMRGVHGNAGGWAPTQNELDAIHRNKVRWVLIPCYEAGQSRGLVQYRGAGVEHFVFRAAIHDPVGGSSPANFIQRTTPILDEYAAVLGSTKNMMIAIGNEPNLYDEGAGFWWKNGADFAEWWLLVAAAYRKRYPSCKLGFPALSPGEAIINVRLAESGFIRFATDAIRAADWIGVHYYWQQSAGTDIAPPLAQWRTWFGSKPLFGTEVGPANNTVITSSAVTKAYTSFAAAGIPMAAWLLSGAGAWQNAEWVTHGIVTI